MEKEDRGSTENICNLCAVDAYGETLIVPERIESESDTFCRVLLLVQILKIWISNVGEYSRGHPGSCRHCLRRYYDIFWFREGVLKTQRKLR